MTEQTGHEDDVRAHAVKARGFIDDDVHAHGRRAPSDDHEGPPMDEDVDDVQGQGIKSGRIARVKSPGVEGDEADDVEGHAARGKA